MSVEAPPRDGHAGLMDAVYRRQRHVYDLTRKFYLLGRDGMLDALAVPPGGTVLELGCGTGRNLVLAARRYPAARLYGLDISAAMLETARRSLARAHLDDRVALAAGDASAFRAQALFGRRRFDRVYLSYALSMIPDWRQAIAAGLDALAPGGALHVVDFGRQERLPGWCRAGLAAWLTRFHVSPREELRDVLESESHDRGASLAFETLFRGYAVRAAVRLPAS